MATSSVLYAAAKEIGSKCSSENRAFLKCKANDPNPSACLHEGEAVQECSVKVLKSAMATCESTFKKYASCLDHQISEEYMFERCRREESDFVDCRSNIKSTASTVSVASVSEIQQQHTKNNVSIDTNSNNSSTQQS